jgi:hypothetical protein
LFPFGKDVVSPGESPIKVESKIFDVVLTGKLQIVQVDGRTSAAACLRVISVSPALIISNNPGQEGGDLIKPLTDVDTCCF